MRGPDDIVILNIRRDTATIWAVPRWRLRSIQSEAADGLEVYRAAE
jgi:hypothetical protein